MFGTFCGVTNNRLASVSCLDTLSACVSIKRPKRPFSPHPHEYTSPALVSAMTWSVPEATFVTLDPSVNKTRRQYDCPYESLNKLTGTVGGVHDDWRAHHLLVHGERPQTGAASKGAPRDDRAGVGGDGDVRVAG